MEGQQRLPTGTVTFLFTDVVGSTRLVREDRAAYAAALDDHRRALRAVFERHGGREVDTQGDAFFSVFATARQAVAAAADGQRALAGTLPVRMGLHTGEPTVAGGTYVGLAVHRAARIATAAAGGQVLLSDATAALVADEMPAGTALRPLGEHRLKDFPQPQALYQLDVEGLPTAFPPPRTLAADRRLPAAVDTLLGRDDDVAALTVLLRDPQTRLITVTGPGGIGKTALALEVARDVAPDLPGGAVFVPLAAITDPALVLPTVADAVGSRPERGSDPIAAVRTALGDDRTLLVLDNVEQVAAAAPGLAALLGAVPAAVVLVTSRSLLHLRSERHHPLGPLAETAAIALFAERAAAIRPGFVLDDSNADAVRDICRRLDGLPLAIELAAARIRLLAPAALLERLGSRLDVLGSGPVDLPERQRTLRATMDWSFDLLTPSEQALFARLAVFSGGWPLEAAETVCGRPGEPDVLDTLAGLLDASLLVKSGGARLDMLQTVRDYAAGRLAGCADREETRRRHTEWVLQVVNPALHVGPGGFGDALATFDRERANVRAAVSRVLDAGDVETAARLIRLLFPYIPRRDAEREALGWVDRILPRAADAPAAVRGRLLLLRASFAAALGDDPDGRLLDEARQLVPDDPEHAVDLASAAMSGVLAEMASGTAEGASRQIDEAAARFAALGMELGVATAAMFRGDLAFSCADLESADRHYSQALELAGRHHDGALIGHVLSARGLVRLARGDVAGGRRDVLDGAPLNRSSGGPSRIASSLEALAALALAESRPAVAARALGAAAAARRSARPLNPALRSVVERLAARVQEELGAEAYEAACAEGRRSPLVDALDRTLDELTTGCSG